MRRRDDDDLSARQKLAERDRHVAGARHVDDKRVEVAPVNVREELLERPCSIGPRHMTGWFSSRNMPIEITFRSPRTGGTIILSTTTGFWSIPSMCGMEKP